MRKQHRRGCDWDDPLGHIFFRSLFLPIVFLPRESSFRVKPALQSCRPLAAMVLIEFRVPLPLHVDEFQVAQLFMVIEASKQNTGDGEVRRQPLPPQTLPCSAPVHRVLAPL